MLERFANTGVRDQIARLCIDGTAKFPTFLVPTSPTSSTTTVRSSGARLALAGWARYLAVVPVDEQAFDASGDVARRHARGAADDPLRFLDFDEVFPPSRSRDSGRFRAPFAGGVGRIADVGALAAMGG